MNPVPVTWPLRRSALVCLALVLLFSLLSLTPRVRADGVLEVTFLSVSALLLLLYAISFSVIARRRLETRVLVIISRPHWVQMIMHLCIFLYWGWYWPQVYHQAILILAQLLFVHALDMMLRWLAGQPWILGFGRFPIIFSTNLFLWFRDDWFYLQFAMIAFGILAKDYFTWTREGRRTHVFNPSAISLSVASTLLIITGSTDISWGSQISNTLNLPPQIYLEIFVLGLVVQYLFHVTLVTLATVISLLLCGAVYYLLTGVYFFYTSDIPIAVFLGLHLLVTDPVTSPRTVVGKILFGLGYGMSVMLLFEVLEYFGAPTFYDKLLAVPLLNLCVRDLDRAARWLDQRLTWIGRIDVSPNRLNLAFMAAWIVIFVAWNLTGHLGATHPGRQSQFWEDACDEDRRKACTVMQDLYDTECDNGNAQACARLGFLTRSGKGIERDDARAYEYVRRACELGYAEACTHVDEYWPE